MTGEVSLASELPAELAVGAGTRLFVSGTLAGEQTRPELSVRVGDGPAVPVLSVSRSAEAEGWDFHAIAPVPRIGQAEVAEVTLHNGGARVASWPSGASARARGAQLRMPPGLIRHGRHLHGDARPRARAPRAPARLDRRPDPRRLGPPHQRRLLLARGRGKAQSGRGRRTRVSRCPPHPSASASIATSSARFDGPRRRRVGRALRPGRPLVSGEARGAPRTGSATPSSPTRT